MTAFLFPRQQLSCPLQGVAADGACKAFDNITGREGLATLEAAAAAGELPRVIAWGTTPAGEWFEFQQGWRPPSGEMCPCFQLPNNRPQCEPMLWEGRHAQRAHTPSEQL